MMKKIIKNSERNTHTHTHRARQRETDKDRPRQDRSGDAREKQEGIVHW